MSDAVDQSDDFEIETNTIPPSEFDAQLAKPIDEQGPANLVEDKIENEIIDYGGHENGEAEKAEVAGPAPVASSSAGNVDGDSGLEDPVRRVGFLNNNYEDDDLSDSDLPASPDPNQPSTSAGPGLETNPYAYLDRDEFTSEKFKVELSNLPRFYGYSELKKLINSKLNLNSHKIKVMTSGSKCAYVNFRSDEERASAIAVLNGYLWKKSTMKAVEAKPAQDPLVRKRTGDDSSSPVKRPKTVSEDQQNEPLPNASELIRNATIPFWNIPYSEQIVQKTEVVNKYMARLTAKLYEINPNIRRKKDGLHICCVEEVRKSPVIDGYRNKCEFTIGYSPEKEKTVGFRLSSYKGGSTYVGPVADLIHIPLTMRTVAGLFETYVRFSEYEPYDSETHDGVWKFLTVRTTLDNQLMMMAVIDVNSLKREAADELKLKMKKYFMELSEMSDNKITSFYVKEAKKHGQPQTGLPELLFGEPGITERIGNLKFKISPESFFQINTKGAELLYSSIRNLADIDLITSVVDICCGTGTVGICLANACGEILGVEMVLDAVRDANLNAQNNGLAQQCRFYAGKAEIITSIVISYARFEKIIAVLDPPRGGVHTRVIQAVRRCERIRSLVYAACDANAAMKNFIDLCRPESKHFKGTAFIPTKLVPVDLFPHTPHLEYVFLFERIDAYYASMARAPCDCCRSEYCKDEYDKLSNSNPKTN